MALARFVASQGVDAKHVVDIGLAQGTDQAIWNYAKENDFLIASKDEDFLHLAIASTDKPQCCPRAGMGATGATRVTTSSTIYATITKAIG